jgi:hypothetical protein
MIKGESFTWKFYVLLAVAAIAGALAVHWGLLNFIAPGPKKLSKQAQEAETKYIGMVANTVAQNIAANPAGNPLANLPLPSHVG